MTRAHLLSVTALLTLVKAHPAPVLQSLATLTITLIESFPRSTAFASESRFLSTLSSWRARAKVAQREAEELFAQAEEELGDDEAEEWTTGFRGLLEILNGEQGRVLEATDDWREALGAWGVWVNPGGRREDLP